MKKINIAFIIFAILCLFFGGGYLYNGINYLTPINGVPEAIVGGFLFLSGTVGLSVQIYIHNQK